VKGGEGRPHQGDPIKEAAAATCPCTVRRVCDFCVAPRTRWVLPAEPLVRFVVGGPVDMAFGTRCYACDTRMPLVERGEWKRLELRVRRLSPAGGHLSSHIGPAVRAVG
jgi:hypothetical protein